jgi:hypothetical protein
MNKIILTLFALSTALPISPVASAQKYDFTYTGSGFTASDWHTIGGAPSQDGNYETVGDLARRGTTFFLVANPAGGRQDLGSASNSPYLGETYTFEYNDLLFTDRANDADHDIYGLLFEKASGTEFIHNRGNGKDTFDSFWTVIRNRLTRRHRGNGGDRGNDGNCGIGRNDGNGRNCGNGRNDGNDSNGGSFPPTPVPEYGGLSMLILSALALAGGFLFKASHPGLFLAA